MKYLFLFLIITVIGCTKDCPECFSFAQPFRLAILNEQGDNLLDSNNINGLMINKITLKSGLIVDFQIKDSSIPNIHVGFWHLESIDEDFFDGCIDQEGELHITYKNSTDIDTINVLIEKKISENGHGCTCVSYPYIYIKHNQVVITEYENEHTGAAIIRK